MNILDKIDSVTNISQRRLMAGGVQPAPKSVKIELTARCNLRCKYCSLRTRKKQPTINDDMSLDFFKAITTDMKKSGVDEIGLFYIGESFMAPTLLVEACKWCKQELDFEWVFLTANATMAHHEAVRKLMDAGLDSLKWSVNFFSPEQLAEIAGVGPKWFGIAMRNIKHAYETRNKYGYKTILSASSILDKGISGVSTDFLDTEILPFVDKHYFLPMYQMGMAKSKTEDIGNATHGNTGRIDSETGKANRPPLPCWAVFTEGHVRVDGGLSACCFGSDARFDMGKLDGTNFMSQWNSEKFVKLREAHIKSITEGPGALAKTACRVCVAYE